MAREYLQAFVAVMESGRVYRVAVMAEDAAAGDEAAQLAALEAAGPEDSIWDHAAFPVGPEMQARGPHVATLSEGPTMVEAAEAARAEFIEGGGDFRAGRGRIVTPWHPTAEAAAADFLAKSRNPDPAEPDAIALAECTDLEARVLADVRAGRVDPDPEASRGELAAVLRALKARGLI